MNKKAKKRILNRLIEADSTISTDSKKKNRYKKLILMYCKSSYENFSEEDITNRLLGHIKMSKEFHERIDKCSKIDEKYYGLLCGNQNG